MAEHDPVILESARRHGVSDEDVQHAFRNPVRTFLVGEDMTMVIGADRAWPSDRGGCGRRSG